MVGTGGESPRVRPGPKAVVWRLHNTMQCREHWALRMPSVVHKTSIPVADACSSMLIWVAVRDHLWKESNESQEDQPHVAALRG